MHQLMISKGNKPRKGKVFTCICGKDFYRARDLKFATHFCSRECKKKVPTTKVTLQCKFCGKDYQTYPSQIKHRGSSYCSRVCLGKQKSISQKGEGSHTWKGGISKENHRIRQSIEFKRWRKAVFERDNYTCVSCGVRGGYLEPDHIKPFAYFPELRFDLNNGRTMCKPCHKQTDTYGVKANRLYGIR